MRFGKSLAIVTAITALMPVVWTVAPNAGAATADELRSVAEAYEAKLNAAWLGHLPGGVRSAVEETGVSHVVSLLNAMEATGLSVVSATSEFVGATVAGTTTSPIFETRIIHGFTYHTPSGNTSSTEAVLTQYGFVNADGNAVLASVTSPADGDSDLAVVPAADDSALPAPGALIGAAADPSGGSDCHQSPPTYCYSRSTAASYAQAHACPSCHDPNWHYYDADCTNFISVALYMGGWEPHGYRKDNYSWWWSTSTNYTNTWTVAHSFYDYARNSHWADPTATISSLRVGDVLQADWDVDGSMNHTMMVTKKDPSGIYLSYHTNDTVNKPFSKIKADNPQAIYTGWLTHSTFRNDWQ